MKKIPVRTLIIETLRELMQKKDFESISVSDIVENAGISRSTFYRYFIDKQNVVECIFEEEVSTSNIYDFSRTICERETDMLSIMMEKPKFWRYLHENPTIRDLWQYKAYEGTLQYLQQDYAHVSELDFFCRVLGIGFIELNRLALDERLEMTPEELGKNFQRLIDLYCGKKNPS